MNGIYRKLPLITLIVFLMMFFSSCGRMVETGTEDNGKGHSKHTETEKDLNKESDEPNILE